MSSRPDGSPARWLFLRLLGLLLALAFASQLPQIRGLVGQGGVLPVREFLAAAAAEHGAARFWRAPTLCWLSAGDGFLVGLCACGLLLGGWLAAGYGSCATVLAAWLCYLSVHTAGQTFFDYQSESLLLETTFLAAFLAPWSWRPRPLETSPPPRLALWLVRWLLFRVLFGAGIAKLASGDTSWRDGTAWDYFLLTQASPHALSWYLHQLPETVKRAATFLSLAVELAAPPMIFLRGWPRRAACASTVAFMAAIMLSGSVGLLGLNMLVLAAALLDDGDVGSLLPRALPPRSPARPEPRPPRWARTAGLALGLASFPAGALVLAATARDPFDWFLLQRTAPSLASWHVFNRYAEFPSMLRERLELVIEGSDDGLTWRAYEFPFKPGDPRRRPRQIPLYRSRLDHRLAGMFLPFGPDAPPPVVAALMRRLLEGSPAVLGLLELNPFPGRPPRRLRAVTYRYRFTTRAERAETGRWWSREAAGSYGPELSR